MDQKTEYGSQQQQQPQLVPHQPSHQVTVQAQANSGLDPRSKEWQYGLFSCFGDLEGCLLACFLPCMLHGRTMDRINDPSLESHEPLNTECLLWGGIQCFTWCGWLYNMVKRTEIRERYGIQGSAASDCGTSYCCLCCALVQQDREVALRAGHYAPVTQGYQGQKQGMQMPGAVHQTQPQHQQGSLQLQQQHQQQSPSAQQQQPMETGIQTQMPTNLQGQPVQKQ